MTNPLLDVADHLWDTPFHLPPFDKILPEHFIPAIDASINQQNQNIIDITNNADLPSFENTLVPFESSQKILLQLDNIFHILRSANTTDAIKNIEEQILSKFVNQLSLVFSNEDLYERIKHIAHHEYGQLKSEQQQLVNLIETKMRRQGAGLSKEAASAITSIDEQLSRLETKFGRNVLNATNDFELLLTTQEELAGLPESVRTMAKSEATARGHKDKYLFNISRSSFTPFMAFSERRDLREKLCHAYENCGNNNDQHDNKSTLLEIVRLRQTRAKLMGYANHNEYTHDDTMAKTPAAVSKLLDQVWQQAKIKLAQEKNNLQARIQAEGDNFELATWDWWFYTEKLRQETLDLNIELVKPYFELNRVRQGAFEVASKLFNIKFKQLDDFPKYHDDTEAFQLLDQRGDHIGIIVTDYFMRPSKRGGAWMSQGVEQSNYAGNVTPIVYNTCNFPKGDPCLLEPDEVRTLFHEFGHGLHGLLSQVTYPSLSGTNVKTDFVELPSQIMENWAFEPEVLSSYAKHYKTGDTLPADLAIKIQQNLTFNQGFATGEYLAASFLDLAWHQLGENEISSVVDAEAFEAQIMADIGLIPEVAPRYKSTYLQHSFNYGYSSSYYAYMWAEVLDADAFDEFKQKGLFDEITAKLFKENILSKGGSQDPMALFEKFKGRSPEVDALLRARGLT